MTSHVILMTSYMMSSIPGKFKMADEREIVKFYYEYKYPAIVNKIVQKRYPGMKPLSRLQFHRLKNKFDKYGTVYDRRKELGDQKLPDQMRTFSLSFKTIIEETPIKSVRRVQSENNLRIGKSSVQRILKYDLKKTPFMMAVMQHLKPTDQAARRNFASWTQDNDIIVDSVWFSDEAHFTLEGHVNKRNFRYWTEEKAAYFHEKPLHCEKVTA